MIFDAASLDEDGYQISYSSPTGELYVLHSHDRVMNKHRRVALKKGGVGDADAKPEFTELESVSRFGVRRTGFRLPPFDGSFDVAVRAAGERAAFVRRDFVQAWSRFREGSVKIVARDGSAAECPVVLTSLSQPEFETAGRRALHVQVGWRCLQGHWWGVSRRYSGVATVVPTGDLPPSCRIVWDMEANPQASVVFPSGQRLSLSAQSGDTGKRFIDLDQGMVGHCTREDGSVDDGMWASLRGRVLGVQLEPHVATSWVLTGCELEVRPRLTSPWR